MSLKRYAAKRDAIEKPIMDALQAIGATVHQLSDDSIPDLLVGFRDETFLLECKTGKGKLTAGQETFMDTWQGGAVYVVRSVPEALHCVGAIDIITVDR